MSETATALVVRTQTYDRERYACLIRVGWKRLEKIEDAPSYSLNQYRLIDPEGVKRTLTRFLRRLLSREIAHQPTVSGDALVEPVVDFITNIPAVRGEVKVFTNVRPDHIEAVQRLVDAPKANRIILRYLSGGIA